MTTQVPERLAFWRGNVAAVHRELGNAQTARGAVAPSLLAGDPRFSSTELSDVAGKVLELRSANADPGARPNAQPSEAPAGSPAENLARSPYPCQ